MNDGGPAFPFKCPGSGDVFSGMSIRDWFAGQALVGLSLNKGVMKLAEEIVKAGLHASARDAIAAKAYAFADAMLKARELSEEEGENE